MAKREQREGEEPTAGDAGPAKARNHQAGDADEPDPYPDPDEELVASGGGEPPEPAPRATGGGDDPPGPMVAILSRFDALLGKLELAAVAASLGLMVGVAVYQFIAVNLLAMKADWTDELIRYSVFFTAMSAAALAAQQKKMMAIDVVPRLLRPRVRAISRVVIALFVVLACYLLFRGGLMARASMAKTPAPYHYISGPTGVLALPVGALLIGVHFLIHAVIDTAYLVAGKTPPAPRLSVH